jgi:hypothetical protein
MTSPMSSAPITWRYLLGAAVALLILLPAWTLFVMLVIQPPSLMQEQPLGSKHFLWWAGIPLLAVVAFFGWRWTAAPSTASAAPGSSTQTTPIAADAQAKAMTEAEAERREYVLEVISLGVTLDKYRQGALWEALKQGNAHASIREQEPEKYPWSADDKEGQEGGREGDTLENGAHELMMYWGIPSFYAGTSAAEPARRGKPADTPIGGLVGGAESSGMGGHLFVIAPWKLAERPDRLLTQVFDFFDAHPDVPLVAVCRGWFVLSQPLPPVRHAKADQGRPLHPRDARQLGPAGTRPSRAGGCPAAFRVQGRGSQEAPSRRTE